MDSIDVLYMFIYSVPHPFHTNHYGIYVYMYTLAVKLNCITFIFEFIEALLSSHSLRRSALWRDETPLGCGNLSDTPVVWVSPNRRRNDRTISTYQLN